MRHCPLLLGFIFLAVSACSLNDHRIVKNDFHGIQLEIPANWEEGVLTPGAILSVRGPETDLNRFRSNLNILIEPLPDQDKKAVFQKAREQIPVQLKLVLRDYVLNDLRETKIGQRLALDFLGTYEGPEGKREIRTILIPRGNEVFTVTGTHSVGAKERSVISKIIESIQVDE